MACWHSQDKTFQIFMKIYVVTEIISKFYEMIIRLKGMSVTRNKSSPLTPKGMQVLFTGQVVMQMAATPGIYTLRG